MFPAIHRTERVSLTCALGLRFWDVATGKFVTDGLTAIAWRGENPISRTLAVSSVVTPGGIHAFHRLPGLRSFENSGADTPWNPPPATREFHIEVSDLLGRFLSCGFRVSPPIEGVAQLIEAGSPSWLQANAIPLFSLPSRPVPAGLAIVRAELRDQASQKPAAWAFVELALAAGGATTTTVRGLADEAGRLGVIFAYPEGQRRAFGSSPPGTGNGLAQQQWAFSASFFYSFYSSPEEEPESVADYGKRLNQPPARAWRALSPVVPFTGETLTFGLELNLGLLELSPI